MTRSSGALRSPRTLPEARIGQELLERRQREIHEVSLVVDNEDLRTLVGLGGKPEGRLKASERAAVNAKVPARGPERLELARLDPVLHGAHRHLAPAHDFTCRQIGHCWPQNGDNDRKNGLIPTVTDCLFSPN